MLWEKSEKVLHKAMQKNGPKFTFLRKPPSVRVENHPYTTNNFSYAVDKYNYHNGIPK